MRSDDHVFMVTGAGSGLGTLHGLVSCAGLAPAERIIDRDGPHGLDGSARTVAINLVVTFDALRLAATAMARNAPDAEGERGAIVNTASVAAFDGQIGQAAYAVSKGGVAALTLPAVRDLARHGIRVVAMAPGERSLGQDGSQRLGATLLIAPRSGHPA